MSDKLIDAYVKWLRATGRHAKTTISERKRALRQADRSLPDGLDEAADTEIIDYRCSGDWAQETKCAYDSHMRGFYHWGVLSGNLSLDPMLYIPRPRRPAGIPNPCTDGEFALAMTAPAPYGMAALLGGYLGLRCCEIVAARREHVGPGGLRVVGKGGKVRIVPIGEAAWEVIGPMGPGNLCPGAHGRPILATSLTSCQREAWHAMGLADTFHLHALRHWYATTLLVQGADIRVVQELLGHASLKTTERYLQVIPQRMMAAVAMLPRIEPGPVSTRPGPAAEAA